MLLRAGLALAPSTVRRMNRRTFVSPSPSPSGPNPPIEQRGVTSRHPNHVWSADITLVSTVAGFWLPWVPGSVVPSWPFCWHVAVVMDHFSRKVLATEAFPTAPTGGEMGALLDLAVAVAGAAPKHIVTDRGPQFREEYLDWCSVRGARPRFGAVGKKGSIAVTERLILTLKREGLWRILVPLRTNAMREELCVLVRWYNEVRPHSALAGATPAEIFAAAPALPALQLEVRERYPTELATRVAASAVSLRMTHFEERAHLPVVSLAIAA